MTVETESWSWVKILNDIFNPTFGFVHIWSKFGLKQPSIFRVVKPTIYFYSDVNLDVFFLSR